MIEEKLTCGEKNDSHGKMGDSKMVDNLLEKLQLPYETQPYLLYFLPSCSQGSYADFPKSPLA